MINKRVATRILSEIKKAKKILLALHVSPDPDGAGSVLAMDLVLRRWRKKTRIISFSQIAPLLLTMPGIAKVKIADFAKENLADFGLFLALDCAQERMITRSAYPKSFPPGFKIIDIDHHVSNTKFGTINLVVPASSTAEIVYDLLTAWKVKINKELARLLFRGIFSDSGCFQYPNTTSKTLRIAAELLDKGASLNECVLQNFRSYSFKTLKYWGKILDNMRLDESGRFMWSKISLAERKELGIDSVDMEAAASLFLQVVAGTEFGIILIEEDGIVRTSLRSRDQFDVSKLAVELGGGGHKQAAGFSLNINLAEAEKKVLEIARKHLARNARL